jgi:hypothetical protein
MTEPQTVAYVLKGYPRRSEIFIASEIHRLERLGVRLRLFVLKPADEVQHHPVVDRVEAEPVYLPATTSLTASKALPWLRANLGAFVPALRRVAARHPWTMTRAAGRAIAQSVRARRGFWAWPRKLYLKEFLLAVALADQLDAAGDVRHLHAHFAHGSATVAWLAATITHIPFSFTGHAKDVYSPSLNPAGLLRRKMAAAEFVVTCTAANRTHLRRLSGDTPVHLAYHGLNADFRRADRPRRLTAVAARPARAGPDAAAAAHPRSRPPGAQEGLRHPDRGVRPAAPPEPRLRAGDRRRDR